MKIEISGPDGVKRRRMIKNVETAVADLGVAAEIVAVEETAAMPPALLVDGDLKVAGRVATVPEIRALLQETVLVVEWRHIGEDIDTTCERCAATGRTLAAVVEEVRPALAARGVRVEMVETVLPPDRIDESNTILFNGTPLEDLLEEVRVEMTPCASCSCIVGTDASCRAVVCGDETCEAVPADLIRRAALKAAGR